MKIKKLHIALVSVLLIGSLVIFSLQGKAFSADGEHGERFPDGRGGFVKIRKDNLDCAKPIFYGDRGEEVKYLQVIINGWLVFNHDHRSIKVDGIFGSETKQGLIWLDAWNGNDNGYPQDGYAIYQYNTAVLVGDHAPCNFLI